MFKIFNIIYYITKTMLERYYYYIRRHYNHTEMNNNWELRIVRRINGNNLINIRWKRQRKKKEVRRGKRIQQIKNDPYCKIKYSYLNFVFVIWKKMGQQKGWINIKDLYLLLSNIKLHKHIDTLIKEILCCLCYCHASLW